MCIYLLISMFLEATQEQTMNSYKYLKTTTGKLSSFDYRNFCLECVQKKNWVFFVEKAEERLDPIYKNNNIKLNVKTLTYQDLSEALEKAYLSELEKRNFLQASKDIILSIILGNNNGNIQSDLDTYDEGIVEKIIKLLNEERAEKKYDEIASSLSDIFKEIDNAYQHTENQLDHNAACRQSS